ncbi:MAG: hypothetical protein QM706_16670 [Nitrospira sp.]
MKKLLIGMTLLALISIAGSLWWVYTSLDAQVASAIRRYGPEIAGVPISLSGVHISLVDGRAGLRGLIVGNPDGFKTNHALTCGEVSMQLDIASLSTDVIRIKEVTLIKPEVTYEYAASSSNLDRLQRNIERYVSQQHGTGNPSRESESRAKLVIEHLYVKNGAVRVSADILGGRAVSMTLSDLHLLDIGKKSNGATAGEAAQQVLNTMTHQITHSLAPLSVRSAGKTIQNGMHAATRAIKDLVQELIIAREWSYFDRS